MTDGNLKVIINIEYDFVFDFLRRTCALILILTIIFWDTLNAIMQVDLHCKKLIEICCKVNKSEYINQQRLVFPNSSYESVSLDWPEKNDSVRNYIHEKNQLLFSRGIEITFQVFRS